MSRLAGFVFINYLFVAFTSCTLQQKISKSARQFVLKDSSLLAAHVGISVYEPASGKYWYQYNSDKYFVPASNTKIATCYAALKYLGDSLICFSVAENDSALFVFPSGDPTFLHTGFTQQPAFDFLKKQKKKIYLSDAQWNSKALGAGWSWNDYAESYMPERSPMPVYGNLLKWVQQQVVEKGQASLLIYSVPEINWPVRFHEADNVENFEVRRKWGENDFELIQGKEKYRERFVPFVTHGIQSAIGLLSDTLGKPVFYLQSQRPENYSEKAGFITRQIKSQFTDDLLIPMMHRSDNFFAEQSLLMVSNKLLGEMNDEKVIATLLKTDFKDLPQKPRWADGSGLSRYNLFTPQDFISILNKMKNEWGMERLKKIFPTGGEGTLSNYYKADSNFLFAKTGTLSGVVALSGFLYTQKGRLLIFSTLVNNHQSSVTAIRRGVEKFLQTIRNRY